MSEAEFWDCTPRYFQARLKAWELGVQRQWEQARYIGYLAVLPHVDGKKRLKQTDLGRFPWEKMPKPVFEPQDEAALKKFENEAIEIFKKMGLPAVSNGDNIRTEHQAGPSHEGLR